MKRPLVAGSLVALLLLQACAAPNTPNTSNGTEVSPSAAVAQSSSEASSATPTVSSPTPSKSRSSVSSSAATSTASSPVAITSAGNKSLGLSDAFNPGGWTEGAYQPASTGKQQQAIAESVGCYVYNSANQLEFRFASVPGTLKVAVAQELNSDSSDAQLEWSLYADGKQVDSKMIAFKESQELSTSLSGVAAVKILVKHKESNCTGSATALITAISVEN